MNNRDNLVDAMIDHIENLESQINDLKKELVYLNEPSSPHFIDEILNSTKKDDK